MAEQLASSPPAGVKSASISLTSRKKQLFPSTSALQSDDLSLGLEEGGEPSQAAAEVTTTLTKLQSPSGYRSNDISPVVDALQELKDTQSKMQSHLNKIESKLVYLVGSVDMLLDTALLDKAGSPVQRMKTAVQASVKAVNTPATILGASKPLQTTNSPVPLLPSDDEPVHIESDEDVDWSPPEVFREDVRRV